MKSEVTFVLEQNPEWALRTHGRLSTILKASKKVHQLLIFDIEEFKYSECIQYTIHWNKTQVLKNFLQTK